MEKVNLESFLFRFASSLRSKMDSLPLFSPNLCCGDSLSPECNETVPIALSGLPEIDENIDEGEKVIPLLRFTITMTVFQSAVQCGYLKNKHKMSCLNQTE